MILPTIRAMAKPKAMTEKSKIQLVKHDGSNRAYLTVVLVRSMCYEELSEQAYSDENRSCSNRNSTRDYNLIAS